LVHLLEEHDAVNVQQMEVSVTRQLLAKSDGVHLLDGIIKHIERTEAF
jgi:hypothetical protein